MIALRYLRMKKDKKVLTTKKEVRQARERLKQATEKEFEAFRIARTETLKQASRIIFD